jgi:DNA-binding transcriptional LysR family regulator
MHLTPSAVSQQLKALEREAGVALTQRSGRGLALTPPGRILAETAKDLAVAIERAESVWAEFVEQPRGEVTVTVFPSVGQMLLPGVLHRANRSTSRCPRGTRWPRRQSSHRRM